MTTNKFHYTKFGIIQIGVNALSQTQISNTPKYLSLKNTKQRTKGSQIPNTNCAQTKERATKQIQKLQRTKREQITKQHNQNQVATKPLSQFQIVTHKYQRIKQEGASFLHTLLSFSL